MPVRPASPLVIIGAGAVLLLGGLFMLSRQLSDGARLAHSKLTANAGREAREKAGAAGSARAATPSSVGSSGKRNAPGRKQSSRLDGVSTEPQATPFPIRNTTLRHRFDGTPDLRGFELKNVVTDPEGLTLPAPDAAGTTRTGTLESPALMVDFQSNSLQPKWQAKVPAGADVSAELCLSTDGKTWTPWQKIALADQQPQQLREDGSPNPDFGTTVGNLMTNGTSLYSWVKWKVTMRGSGTASPVLQGFSVWYDDSTGGQGQPAAAPAGTSPQGAAGTPTPAAPIPTPVILGVPPGRVSLPTPVSAVPRGTNDRIERDYADA